MQHNAWEYRVRRLIQRLFLIAVLGLSMPAVAADILVLEQNRVEAQAPVELHASGATTSLDFFEGSSLRFRIRLSTSPLGLTIENGTGGVLLAFGTSTLTLPATGISGAGHNSGLDADKVDGIHGGSFLRTDASSTVAAGNTLTVAGNLTLPGSGITGAGSGSGLNADKLDGFDALEFLQKQAGFTWNAGNAPISLSFNSSAQQGAPPLLKIDATAKKVGINVASPQAQLDAASDGNDPKQLRLSFAQ